MHIWLTGLTEPLRQIILVSTPKLVSSFILDIWTDLKMSNFNNF